ncbi:Sec23-binding domain of Sec16-domain-containing protein [Dendryphion nanum]|uniref:Protein transport protein sec16 n=1 Tax=Dendryphion nanum TaxID=256645 RepID=A0A9P9IFM1_9PLEO|nr:Sec23-binding domain of Sec16-domain-containing protein [Dendryphion nanum]
MASDDAPNFGYAFGTTTNAAPSATTSSWNPALRPDHDESLSTAPVSKPITHSPRILPHSQTAPETSREDDDDDDDEEDEDYEEEEDDDDDDDEDDDEEEEDEDESEEEEDDDEEKLPTATIAPVIPTHARNSSWGGALNSDEDFFNRDTFEEDLQNASRPPAAVINGHGVNGAEEADSLVSGLQALGLENKADAGTNGSLPEPTEQKSTINAEFIDEHPAETYEHQGETTLLEEAIAESAKAPLIDDAEPAIDEWGSSGEVFDLGGKAQDAPLSTPHAEAVGTTVGDQVIGNTTIGGNTGGGIDWGTGDDDFFGNSQKKDASDSKSAASAEPMWDLELDDEFLPDADDAPAPFVLDDDEGFLQDEPEPPAQAAPSGAGRYAPQATQAHQSSAPSPQFTNFAPASQSTPIPSPSYGGYGQPAPARPSIPNSAQSFADKAKGGYSSPYDLPEDVVTTRRRPAARPAAPSVQSTPAPPRSSSYSNAASPALQRPPPSNMSASSLSPPSSSNSNHAPITGMAPPPKPPAKSPSSDFFAELPLSAKPRPSGRHTPQHHTPQQPPIQHAPPQLTPKERTSSWSSLRNEVLPDNGPLDPQLRRPDQLPVFPDQPSVPVRTNSLPVPQQPPVPLSSRYSPAPPSAPQPSSRYSPAPPSAPAPNARYSPAPPSQQGAVHNRIVSDPPVGHPRHPSQTYAPRTSSPLAFHSTPLEEQTNPPVTEQQGTHYQPEHHATQSVESVSRTPFRNPLEGVSESGEQSHAARSGTPPPLRSGPPSSVSSPRKRPSYTPQYQSSHPVGALPARAQSQSPEASMKQPQNRHVSHDQGFSPYGVGTPVSAFGMQTSQPIVNTIPHKRQISHDFQYIAPTDERAADPLERYKGHPIFHWGLGGSIITSFPKQIPRYGGGASVPMMKSSPGEVKIQNVKEVLPLPEEIAKFPGPLKSKSKKKEVSAWLGRNIEAMGSQLSSPVGSLDASANPKRFEEKILLLRILQIFVDNDGHLEGNATAETAVRKVLSPEEVDSSIDSNGPFSTAAELIGPSRSNTLVQSETVDPKAIEEIRQSLTRGDREKAVWRAVDQRLWGHAMLLSSTLNKDLWKQVIQEFVRNEVKKVGRDNQALAVLYEVFAGNWEDCIDELVPASARAGFQMVSTDGAGASQNALEGLEKWRETLVLILSNRSEGDNAALLSLGRLLAGYGRAEAAHICFMFARSLAVLGGVDDAQSDLVLIGADHRLNSLDLGNDVEPILLTEVYEFGLSLSSTGNSHILPHLQSYKLAHAYNLAEYGYRTDAQSYCDAIAATIKSTTRISPYYNASFLASLEDLSKRLSQSPKDGSSSWISKPSMDKVSSSLLSKFNSFIAGDDEDAAANQSGGAEVGPFAKIAGNTPTISPSQSSADLYGAYSGYGAGTAAPSAPANSRYAPSSSFAPSNAYAPRSSSEQVRSPYEPQGRQSMESQPSTSNPYLPSPSLSGPYTPLQQQFSPPAQRAEAHAAGLYSPLAAQSSAPSYVSPYQPTPPTEESAPSYGGYQQPQASFDTQQPVPSSETTQASTGGYEPPTNSYEPVAYQPYNPDEEERSTEEEQKPKKKSFLDDDDEDDIAARAAALKGGKSKSDADRAADEAFRKAAEADAARDKEGGANKKGWFGGWFGKKDPNAGPGPIKAKLGEESSFYYDPELKKWVNKKGGAAEPSRPIATPPPPKSGPPSRSVSGNSVAAHHALGGAPSSLPHSAMSAPPTRAPTSNPQRSASMPPPMSGPASRASTPGLPSDNEGGGMRPPVLMPPSLGGNGPPSRPGTGMSNASSIEDLIGAPATVKRGPGAKGKKRGGRDEEAGENGKGEGGKERGGRVYTWSGVYGVSILSCVLVLDELLSSLNIKGNTEVWRLWNVVYCLPRVYLSRMRERKICLDVEGPHN